MSNHFMEALAGEISKEASMRGVKAAVRRAMKMGRRARSLATRGAGLKGATKLGQAGLPPLAVAPPKPPSLPKSQAQTMEGKIAPPPKPLTPTPSMGGGSNAQKMPRMPGQKAAPLAKNAAAGVKAALLASQAGKALKGKVREVAKGANRRAGKAQDQVERAVQTAKERMRDQEVRRKAKELGLIGATAAGGGYLGAKTAAEDSAKAGAMVKAILDEAKKPQDNYTDSQQIGVDDPRFGGGKGLKNLGGKRAPAFTDKVNPTDMPGAFGTGSGDQINKIAVGTRQLKRIAEAAEKMVRKGTIKKPTYTQTGEVTPWGHVADVGRIRAGHIPASKADMRESLKDLRQVFKAPKSN